eukprot:6171636-Prymnesium_polylepis.1
MPAICASGSTERRVASPLTPPFGSSSTCLRITIDSVPMASLLSPFKSRHQNRSAGASCRAERPKPQVPAYLQLTCWAAWEDTWVLRVHSHVGSGSAAAV